MEADPRHVTELLSDVYNMETVQASSDGKTKVGRHGCGQDCDHTAVVP